ncbi:MAG: glycosyl transferase family protein [Methylococcaceae bacterium]|nr:glycosyl transferase family protein [Methylococcaceae bacterium]
MNIGHHEQTRVPAHPFAEFIRILGKGKKGARDLTLDEAYRAMQMILSHAVEPEQLGAFLMLMRIKEETAEELVGFVQAARESLPVVAETTQVDLDWSSYAGKRRHLPWFLLAALLLSENGIKVFMHGSAGQTEGRLYTEEVLQQLGIKTAQSFQEAEQHLQQYNFCYLPLQIISPKLYDIIELRNLMGLRSPVHTLVRLLNPFNAPYSIQGIFHPSYRAVHQLAAAQLGQQHMAVLKGEGGETERNPDMTCLVQSVHEGILSDEHWPALFEHRHVKAEHLDPQALLRVWQGKQEEEFALASITGTCAVALRLLGKADSLDAAQAMSNTFWQNRQTQTLPLR